MTTFQDPPPQSRRAVRQSERGEAPAELSAQAVPYSFDAQPPVTQAESASGSDAQVSRPTGRRAQLPSPTETPATSSGSGYRPAPPSGLPTGFEPLTYVTQARPVAPGFDAPVAQPVSDRQPAPTTGEYSRDPLSAQQAPAADQAPYRLRDFSPDGRRAALSREQFQNVSSGAVPVQAPLPSGAPLTAPVDLDYFTQGVAPGAQHAATPPAFDESVSDHTLTRRELRELRAAQEAPPVLRLPEPIDALLNSGPIEISTLSASPGQSQALADAMAEFDALTRSRRETEARSAGLLDIPGQPIAGPPPAMVEQPAIVAPPALVEPPAPEPQSDLPLAAIQHDISPTDTEEAEAPVAASNPWTSPTTQWTAPASTWAAPVAEAAQEPVPPQEFVVAPQPAALEVPVSEPLFIEPQEERAPLTRPVGHWSVQAQVDDDEQSVDSTMGRTVGAGSVAVTTSALILPSVPQATDITSPFSSTGEILVTGSIDLPRSLSATGAHPHRIDNSDFEDDPLDSQVTAADSAPVRAIRAVSTHTSTRGVIESKRPQSNRMPTIMIVAASVLAVGVVGLLVAAAVLHLFS